MLGVSCKQKLVFYYSYSKLAVHVAEYLLISLAKSHVVSFSLGLAIWTHPL